MSEVYRIFAADWAHLHDFSDEMLIELYNAESFGPRKEVAERQCGDVERGHSTGSVSRKRTVRGPEVSDLVVGSTVSEQ
jgi:hypothetical protein